MSWQEEGRAVLKAVVAAYGGVVHVQDSYYGRSFDRYAERHRIECGWDSASVNAATLEIETLTEFTDTFNDPNEQEVVELGPVDCKCGALRDRTVRYTGGLAELIRLMIAEEEVPA